MRYATAAAFRSALETRLKAQARDTPISLVRLRKMVVFDRLLARLVVAAPDRWVLKGGLALEFRFGLQARATKDMDLARQDGIAATTADFIAVQGLRLDDYFVFAIEQTERLNVLEGAAVRYRVRAELAGRLFDEVTIDVGFSDTHVVAPDTLRGPDLFAFAGLLPVEVPALPLSFHIAEKVHAYTRSYGDSESARPNTRVKDLIDLALIASTMALNVSEVRAALDTTFEARATHALPAALPPPPPDWARPYAKLARDIGLAPDLADGFALAAAFIDPLLQSAAAGSNAQWDPTMRKWMATEERT